MSNTNLIINKEKSGSKDRFWHPRMWDGMTMRHWFRQAAKGHFRVAVSGVPMFGIISALSVFNSGLSVLQSLFYGKKIRETRLEHPPIFIIGHWRSGTTLLHEYIMRNSRFTCADTYSCFCPTHFLHTRHYLRPMTAFLIPKKRPMDNMATGFDHPQEDEFALCALGLGSPYLNIMYPNHPPIDMEYLTLKNLSDAEQNHWLDGLEYYLRCLTVAENKQIVLKSPPHTGRIAVILKRFPEAKFIHMHRNPYTLFASTFNLWIQLARVHGLQRPKGIGLEERVFNQFETMYHSFAEDIELLKPGQFLETAYRDLISEPVPQLEKIYTKLAIPGFEEMRETLLPFAETQKNYRKNKFEMDPQLKDKITQRWSWYINRYGYTADGH
ncbi:MAG: sulfotransferase [Planctomycetaceae bacterium]|jgi:hypothetical protein|nr:sulfotransferase [Planctomycetaceae bacterium]